MSGGSKSLEDSDRTVRGSAVIALGNFRDERASAALRGLLTDERFKFTAQQMLDQQPQREATDSSPERAELLQLARDADTLAGESYGPAEFDRLWKGRQLFALQLLDVCSLVPDIIILDDQFDKFTALAGLATPEAVDYLTDCLKSDNRALRQGALEGIQAQAGRWAVPLLLPLLDDPKLDVKSPGRLAGVNGRDVTWPDGHRALAALSMCLDRAGLKVRFVNLATGDEAPQISDEIARLRDWWIRHGTAFLEGRDVPNPGLTTVGMISN